MDDFVIMLPTKEECKKVLDIIKRFLKEKLDLELNAKTRYYPNKFGCNFCGYVIHEYHMLLRRKCIINIKRKLRKHNLKLENFHGHLMHANCFNFIQVIKKQISLYEKEKEKKDYLGKSS